MDHIHRFHTIFVFSFIIDFILCVSNMNSWCNDLAISCSLLAFLLLCSSFIRVYMLLYFFSFILFLSINRSFYTVASFLLTCLISRAFAMLPSCHCRSSPTLLISWLCCSYIPAFLYLLLLLFSLPPLSCFIVLSFTTVFICSFYTWSRSDQIGWFID